MTYLLAPHSPKEDEMDSQGVEATSPLFYTFTLVAIKVRVSASVCEFKGIINSVVFNTQNQRLFQWQLRVPVKSQA